MQFSFFEKHSHFLFHYQKCFPVFFISFWYLDQHMSEEKKIDHRFVSVCTLHNFHLLAVQEMGVIGPDNQLPRRRSARGRGGVRSILYDDKNSQTDDVHVAQFKPPHENSSDISEALSLFPHPKALLTRVVQVATSSESCKVSPYYFHR